MKIITIICLLTFSLSGFLISSFGNKNVPNITEINCISYDPNYKIKFDPKAPLLIQEHNIDSDLSFISKHTKCIRIYTSRFGHEQIPWIAQKYGLEVVAGAWITDEDNYDNELEINTLIGLANEYKNIKKVIVGNEVFELKLTTNDRLIKYIEKVKNNTSVKVSTTFLSSSFKWSYDEIKPIFKHLDFIAIHILPYWYNIDSKKYIEWTVNSYDEVFAKVSDKDIFIAEIGIPSRGQANLYGDEMSRYQQAVSVRSILEIFNGRKLNYNLIGAFDQPWQRFEFGGLANVFFGLFSIYKTNKFPLTGAVPYVDMSIIYPIFHVIFTLLLFFSIRKKILKVGIIYSLVSFHFIYISFCFILDYFLTSYPYLSYGQFFFGFNLFIFLILSIFHSFEFIYRFFWVSEKETSTSTSDHMNKNLKSALIIIPFTDEPIRVLERSINSIQSQTYEHLNIILVSNNNNRSDLESIKELFTSNSIHLVHYSNIKGYKAGAINKAVSETTIEYDVLFILDSDYKVNGNWISNSMDIINTNKANILFYPQAYEIQNNSTISKLIQNEYSGYSKFSLPIRAKHNVGILHGAMLCIEKNTFINLGMFNKKSITEDADFGVKAIINGEKISYIEEVYGRGVFPSTYKSYTTQRERWVSGAVKIAYRNFFPIISSKKISSIQKLYLFLNWLPWIATLPYLIFVVYQMYYYDQILRRYHYMDGVYYFLPFPVLFFFMLYTHTLIKKYTLAISTRMALLTCISSLCLLRTISFSIFKSMLPFTGKVFNITNKNSTIREYSPIALGFNLLVLVSSIYYAWKFALNFKVYSFQIYLQFTIMFIVFIISISEVIMILFYQRKITKFDKLYEI